jgi:hypothetical protein
MEKLLENLKTNIERYDALLESPDGHTFAMAREQGYVCRIILESLMKTLPNIES